MNGFWSPAPVVIALNINRAIGPKMFYQPLTEVNRLLYNEVTRLLDEDLFGDRLKVGLHTLTVPV
jgi:hypothetical protein